MIKQYKDKEWLENKYLEEKLSTHQIGKLFKVNNGTIQYWLKKYNIPIRSYSEANIGNNKGGYKLSEEFKEKARKRMLGNKVGFQSDNIPWNKDIPCSGETKKKISEALKGAKNFNYGKHRTEETKKKIGESHKGMMASEKTKKMMSINRKGNRIKEETKKKISETLRGEKSHLWKGGVTLLSKLIRTNFKYRQWRSDIFTRDNFTCQDCGQIGGRLNAHHKKSLSSILQKYEITTLGEALDCEELWNINNGITLCRKCHKKTDNFGRRGVTINEYIK